VNLMQEDERPDSRDGTGRVFDDIAQERIAMLTEVGPMQGDQGVVDVEPGQDDTSAVIRSHHPKTEAGRTDSVVEGNVDQPMDETLTERKADEARGA
jgi:N utilization substance protein A